MVRIQLRRDTAANWTSSNPVLRAGELGIETDTLKFKVGNGTSTWTQITAYANVTSDSLTSSLSDYIESADLGQPSGPAQLTGTGDLLVPEDEIVMWSADTNTYTTTLVATEPTEDRIITLKDGTGTLAFTSDLPTQYTDELAQDAAAAALAAGTHTNITVTYDDNANSISLSAAPGYVDEQAVDAVAAALAAGTHTNITVGYNDAGNAISLTGAVTYTDENAQDAVGNAVGTGLSYNDTTGAISVDTSTIQARVTDVSDTEIGYLNGVTSAIQTQIDNKASLSGATFTGAVSGTSLTLSGDLTVNGTTTTLNSTTLSVDDKNIELGSVATPSDATADGGGITLKGTTDKTFNWVDATDSWTSSEHIDLASGKSLYLNGTPLKDATETLTNKTLTSPVINTPTGITKSDVGLANVDNTSDANKPVSTATQTALDLKANLASPTFTGTVSGITATMVGLGNVDNTSDANKPVSTATQTALDLKVDESLFDAKGDLLVGSADNVPAKLTVGTNGYLLTADSNEALGVKWAAAPVSLPSQTGESGKYLTTDGTNASWGTLVVPISTGTVTVNQNTAQDVDTTALSAFTSIEYMISIKQGSKVRTSKVILQTDGTSVDMTEFAITETGGTISGVVVSATTESSNGKLQVTVTDALSTNATVKFSKVAL